MTLPDGLFRPPFAHRGLWRPGDAPENSLAAFGHACEAGYGIELDVRLSSDGEAVVFHDETLERMTGQPGFVWEQSASELTGLRFLDGPGCIPTLAQTLELIAGRAMLLVEIKDPPPGGVLQERVARLLDRYDGPACVISFDAGALAWFAEHRPDRLRGLDAQWISDQEIAASGDGRPRAGFEAHVHEARPHFLGLEVESAMGAIAAQHRANGLAVVAWTVRSVEQAARVAEHCDNFIFEGFTA